MTPELSQLGASALRLGLNVLGAACILVVGWFVSGWVKRTIDRAAARRPHADRTLAQVGARIARWAILVFTALAVLNRFGVQTTSIVALLGAAGLTVGLALQGTLSNVAAGVMLLALRPFRIGDAVDVGGISGSVDDLGLFLTRITTFEGVPIHIPNSEVWGKAVRNFSQAKSRRLDLSARVGYDDDVTTALGIMREIVVAESRVLTDPEPAYFVDALADNSVNLVARFWTLPADLAAVQWKLTEDLKERMSAAGMTAPYPKRNVLLVQTPATEGGDANPNPNPSPNPNPNH